MIDNERLNSIEQRILRCQYKCHTWKQILSEDAPALLAEVRRLREELEHLKRGPHSKRDCDYYYLYHATVEERDEARRALDSAVRELTDIKSYAVMTGRRGEEGPTVEVSETKLRRLDHQRDEARQVARDLHGDLDLPGNLSHQWYAERYPWLKED